MSSTTSSSKLLFGKDSKRLQQKEQKRLQKLSKVVIKLQAHDGNRSHGSVGDSKDRMSAGSTTTTSTCGLLFRRVTLTPEQLSNSPWQILKWHAYKLFVLDESDEELDAAACGGASGKNADVLSISMSTLTCSIWMDPPATGATPAAADTESVASNSFVQLPKLTFLYRDLEGDLVQIASNEELMDALKQYSSAGSIKVTVHISYDSRCQVAIPRPVLATVPSVSSSRLEERTRFTESQGILHPVESSESVPNVTMPNSETVASPQQQQQQQEETPSIHSDLRNGAAPQVKCDVPPQETDEPAVNSSVDTISEDVQGEEPPQEPHPPLQTEMTPEPAPVVIPAEESNAKDTVEDEEDKKVPATTETTTSTPPTPPVDAAEATAEAPGDVQDTTVPPATATAQVSSTKLDATGKFIHGRHTCDGCLTTPIIGNRYHCEQMSDYDLCEACIHNYKGTTLTFTRAELDSDRPFQEKWRRRYKSWNPSRGGRFVGSKAGSLLQGLVNFAATSLLPSPSRDCQDDNQSTSSSEDPDVKEAIRRSLEDAAFAEAKAKEGAVAETKETVVETKEETVETKEVFVETKEEIVETKEEAVESKEETVESKNEAIETKEESTAVNDKDAVPDVPVESSALETHRIASMEQESAPVAVVIDRDAASHEAVPHVATCHDCFVSPIIGNIHRSPSGFELCSACDLSAQEERKQAVRKGPLRSSRRFIHGRHTCDSCFTTPIVGKRYHAQNVPDCDLCERCMQQYETTDVQFMEEELVCDLPFQDKWRRRYVKWLSTGKLRSKEQQALFPNATKVDQAKGLIGCFKKNVRIHVALQELATMSGKISHLQTLIAKMTDLEQNKLRELFLGYAKACGSTASSSISSSSLVSESSDDRELSTGMVEKVNTLLKVFDNNVRTLVALKVLAVHAESMPDFLLAVARTSALEHEKLHLLFLECAAVYEPVSAPVATEDKSVVPSTSSEAEPLVEVESVQSVVTPKKSFELLVETVDEQDSGSVEEVDSAALVRDDEFNEQTPVSPSMAKSPRSKARKSPAQSPSAIEESFCDDAAGNGDIAFFVAETLDRFAKEIQSMQEMECDFLQEDESEDSDEEDPLAARGEDLDANGTTLLAGGATIVEGENDKNDEVMEHGKDDASTGSWSQVEEDEEKTVDDIALDRALAEATAFLGSALFNSDMERSNANVSNSAAEH